MNRAVVLIGVRQTGGLPRLETAWDGVARMERWALNQGIPKESISLLTDEHAVVDAVQIANTIKKFVDRLTIEQLVVYFTGHGLNLGQSEFWLLSGFPDGVAAVANLAASIERARTGPIPHVVFISDACRTAGAGIQQQVALNGGIPIFPTSPAGPYKSVDVFYATTLGRPALEVQDPNDPLGGFRGVYTEALVDALLGKPPIRPEPEPELAKGVIRSWTLKRHLEQEVPRRMVAVNPRRPPSQLPDAVISSDPEFWVSVVEMEPEIENRPVAACRACRGCRIDPGFPEVPLSRLPNVREFSQAALHSVLSADKADVQLAFADAKAGPAFRENEATLLLEADARATAAPFGPKHFETMCGFKIRGAEIVEAVADDAIPELFSNPGDACRVSLKNRFANVLLTFQTGQSVVLPAISEFIAGLTFEGDELIDVSYEPSDNSSRWQTFLAHQEKLRSLRGIIAASTRQGTFQLEQENDAERVARDMQVAKGVDPSLGIYAAYAYRRQGNQKRLDEIVRYMGDDLGMVFFDIAMLAGGAAENSRYKFLPPLPLLTQGWALVDACEIPLPDELKSIRQHVNFNSLWTVYGPEGTQLLKQYLTAKGG